MHPLTADASLAGHPGRLLPDENVLGTLEVDLDGTLHFSRSTLVLTDQRLLWTRAGATDWTARWPLAHTLTLRHHDHAGVGTLELHVLCGRPDTGFRQHIPQPHSGPLRIPDGTPLPLHTRHFRTMKRAAVAAALQHGGHGKMVAEPGGVEFARAARAAVPARLGVLPRLDHVGVDHHGRRLRLRRRA